MFTVFTVVLLTGVDMERCWKGDGLLLQGDFSALSGCEPFNIDKVKIFCVGFLLSNLFT